MKTLPVDVCVTRYQSNGEPREGIHIYVRDKVSGDQVVRITLSLEEFSRAVTASQGEGTAEYRITNLGKRHENKTEIVTIPDGPDKTRDARVAEAVAVFEVDGWSGQVEDASNHHRSVSGERIPGCSRYRVTFHRYVDVGSAMGVSREKERQ